MAEHTETFAGSEHYMQISPTNYQPVLQVAITLPLVHVAAFAPHYVHTEVVVPVNA